MRLIPTRRPTFNNFFSTVDDLSFEKCIATTGVRNGHILNLLSRRSRKNSRCLMFTVSWTLIKWIIYKVNTKRVVDGKEFSVAVFFGLKPIKNVIHVYAMKTF